MTGANPDAPAEMPDPAAPTGMPPGPGPAAPHDVASDALVGMPYRPSPATAMPPGPASADGVPYRSSPAAGTPAGPHSGTAAGVPAGPGSPSAAGVPAGSGSGGSVGVPDSRVLAIPAAARGMQGRRAGLISRLLANTVDFGVVVVIVAAGYAGVAALRFLWNSRTFTFPAPGFGPLVLIGSAVLILYLTAGWIAAGRTYGDHLLGLRVVGRRGRPLRRVTAFVRAVLCVVFPIGLFWIVISRDNRSVQDVLLRSSVVYDWSRSPLTRSGGR